ncbi:MAG: toxin-antitoxin system YwqK family antitoxin [Flavobacteriales bacterium]|nr:toxin-antitoxin system YwqK family antitoxin [Flavobacteriales bacterium]
MVRIIDKLTLLSALVLIIAITSCGSSDNANMNVDHGANGPLIIETNEGEIDADVIIDNTFPTEGMPDGPFETYYPNGQLQVSGTVYQGKRSGLWVAYHLNGNKQSENNYDGGQLKGKTAVFYSNGQVMYIGYYENGVYDGQWLYFEEDGTLIKEIIYENGKKIQENIKNEKPE